MGVILYLVLYGQFPYMPPGEAPAQSMKQAIKQDLPPLRFERSQAQMALSSWEHIDGPAFWMAKII